MTRRPQPRALAARRRRRTLTRLSLRHTRVTRNTPPSSSTYSRLASVSFSLFAMSRSAVCSRTQRRSVPSPLGSRSLLPHHAFACTTARTDQVQGREPGARPVHAPRREEVGEALSHRPLCPLARSHCRRRNGRPRRQDVTYMTADRVRLPTSLASGTRRYRLRSADAVERCRAHCLFASDVSPALSLDLPTYPPTPSVIPMHKSYSALKRHTYSHSLQNSDTSHSLLTYGSTCTSLRASSSSPTHHTTGTPG